MLYSSNISIGDFKPDIRSARGTKIQRGLFIRLLRVVMLVFLDAASLSGAWNLAISYGNEIESPWTQNLYFLLLNIVVQLFILATNSLYKAGSSRRNYLRIIKSVSLSSLLLLCIAFIYEPNSYISRSTFILYWLVSVALICSTRFLFDISTNFARQKGAVRHPIFIITDTQEKDEYLQLFKEKDCYTIKGFASSRCLDLVNREETFESLRSQGVEEVFVSWSAIKNRLFLSWHFSTAGITLHVLPSIEEFHLPKSKLSFLGEIPCPTISAQIFVSADFWIKRFCDFCSSLILILFFSPLYFLIAAAIKFDSDGPIFFRQKRIGLHGQEFLIWKFRTMVTNAEQLQVTLEAQNEIKDGVVFKMKDDPRITKVGKLLRRYSLDELPQLFNVLLGDMSLVGPRPLPIRDVEKFKTKHFIRQEVLPGITGLWQVSGRSNIDNFDDVVKLDMAYIENWSIALDFKILLRTVQVVFQKTGAY